APGAVFYGGALQAAIPFAVIDCSQCDAKGGWIELHALLWEPQSRSATLGIFYLEAHSHSQVIFEYVIDLRSLRQMRGSTYAAEWAFSGAGSAAIEPRPL
ncbi:MAG TPA: hypothetical protein VI356_23325, partial [Myxococcales bacterium]